MKTKAHMKKRSISRKIITLVAISVILGVTATALVSLFRTSIKLNEQIDKTATAELDYATQYVEGFLENRKHVVDTLALNPQASIFAEDSLRPLFVNLLKEDEFISSIFVASMLDGQIILYQRTNNQIDKWIAPADYDSRTRDWFTNAIKTPVAIYNDPYVDMATGDFVITISRCIQDATGSTVGVAGIDINIDSLADTISALRFGREGYAFLVDSNGTVIAHADKNEIGKNAAAFENDTGKIVRNMLNGESGKETTAFNGVKKLVYYSYLSNLDWGIAITLPQDEVNEPIREILYRLIVVALLVLAIIIAIVIIITNRSTRPLVDVVTKLETARFCRTLGTLLKSGVPFLQALNNSKDVMGNRIMAGSVDSITRNVREGKGIAAPLMDASIFPQLALSMIKVGEETGQLDTMLLRVATTYEKGLRDSVKRFMSLLEPAIILAMGIIIAFIVISMLMAVFSILELPF